jgi:membrane protein YqaA with SNARE-associated domain
VSVLVALATMFATAFVAATVFPAQSELVFLGFLKAQIADPLALFAAASVGNTLGAVVNWGLGRLLAMGAEGRIPARLRPTPEQVARGEAAFLRHGWVALFLSWVPIIGDVATVAAGTLHYPLLRFILIVGLGKAARYAALWAGFAYFA